jgi:dTMP kinase
MKFVALEGIDGAGKTTVRATLAEALRGREVNVAEAGEFKSAIGPQLLALLPTLTALEKVWLFAADRSLSLKALDQDAPSVVVWDRYVASAFAYRWAEERVNGPDPAVGEIMPFVELSNRSFPLPDLYVYLDIDPEISAVRTIDGPPPQILELVPRGYQRYFGMIDVPCETVDGRQSVDEVTEACEAALLRHGIMA